MTSGVIEKNEICMSESFRQPPMRSLIDGGAIYVWTQNKDLLVRENYIHDIAGPHGNRGIFADDGPVNVTISGNRVERIHNGYCIDLRRCLRTGWKKKSQIPRANVGNRIVDNTYDGRVRLFIRRKDPSSEMHDNIRITSK